MNMHPYTVTHTRTLQVLVSSPLRRQRIKPDAKLTSVLTSVRPKDSVLEPLLDQRDSLPVGRVAYRLVLSYTFTISEGGKYTPAVPLTNGCVCWACCVCVFCVGGCVCCVGKCDVHSTCVHAQPQTPNDSAHPIDFLTPSSPT